MKIERIFTYCLLAGTFILASCSNENDVSDSNRLPEGQYPVTFTAAGLEATPVSRATADDTWEGNEAVAVKIGNEVKKYTPYSPNSNSASVTLKAAEGVTPFYWKNMDDINNVSAWYFGTRYDGTFPASWSVRTRQDINNGYQQSDFLYAPPTDIDFQGTKPLIFFHQTAKVVVNIRNNGLAGAVGKIDSVSINAVSEGTFKENTDGIYGLSASGSYADITFQTTGTNTNVVFEKDKDGETALASYRVLVIPQEAIKTTITIKINGYAPFKYIPTVPDKSGSWEGGKQYTYNLTVDGKEVTATVIATTISWGDQEGGTGAGSVEI